MTQAKDTAWGMLSELIEGGDSLTLEEYLQGLGPRDALHAFFHLDTDDQSKLLLTLTPEIAADLVEELPDTQAVDLIERLEPENAAAIIEELPSAEQADLIGELEWADAQEILEHIEPEDASDIRELVQYPSNVAGGLMGTEYLTFSDKERVSDVITDLGENAEHYGDFPVQYIYITNTRRKLLGVVPFRSLLLHPSKTLLSKVMIRDPLTVSATATLEELESFFDHHSFMGVPVIDKQQRILGVVRRAAVSEAHSDQSDSDYMKTQGIITGEELRSMPLASRSLGRLSWLSTNIVLNLVGASVIAMYQDTLSAAITLAVFLPVISDMSGCSGNQAVAVSMRELSLGIVRPNEILRVWKQEFLVGLINGIVLGLLLALLAWLWQGNTFLGLVVGVALAVNTVIAASLGGIIPLALKRAGKDPALASGPILTTVTDLCGFFLLLSLASFFLSQLTSQ